MYLLARSSSIGKAPRSMNRLRPRLADAAADLRIVKLPGLRYAIDHAYGSSSTRKLCLRQNVTTTTTGGQPYTVGGDLYNACPEVHVREHHADRLIWIRTHDAKETSWTPPTRRSERSPPRVPLSAAPAEGIHDAVQPDQLGTSHLYSAHRVRTSRG
jgi:hypothetical protein